MIPNGGTFGGKHTYNYFGMIPKSKIIFAPPAPKIKKVPLPNTDGELDYTELLTGGVTYGNRKGTIEFIVLESDGYQNAYEAALEHFHGQKMTVVLDDDPGYSYTGRFKVNAWKSWEGHSTIAIDYNLAPLKVSLENTGDEDWLFNDVIEDESKVIYYGSFAVSGEKARNLINPSENVLSPKITCSSAMDVEFYNNTYHLPYGTTDASGILLAPGNNYMIFKGTGTVQVSYPLESGL